MLLTRKVRLIVGLVGLELISVVGLPILKR